MWKWLLIVLIGLFGCQGEEDEVRRANRTAAPIRRLHTDEQPIAPPVEYVQRAPYPWELDYIGAHPRITKEFFRCKGSSLNPPRGEGEELLHDCGGSRAHGLPLFDGKEGVYPILPELLNYLQERTGKRVVITCGHRCPAHNSYADPSPSNRTSKHMIGGEVDFYVQGMEEEPEAIVDLLIEFYQKNERYAEDPNYTAFHEYRKETNVSTPPLYNKEVFIKLYEADEGRDYDNRHPYPYIGIQVRYAFEEKRRVAYDWHTAHRNYLRR
jgi:hypothetical protein